VNRSPVSKQETLRALGMARSTFYRWQKRYRAQGEVGLMDRRPEPGAVWNRLHPAEQEAILAEALQQPDLSPRELGLYVSDHRGLSVSESTVYRILKRHGLNREVRLQGFPAGPEYRMKTVCINQQWQSDASYFFVVGWGWYYLISVMDDFSRMILAWDLMLDMTAESIGDIVERAVEFTGMRSVPVEDKTKLLTDNGPGYIARVLEDYLRMQSIPHLRCSPHHPQTNGKLERFHQTLKTRLNVLVYTSPEALRRAMTEFIEYYNQRRYHEGIGNVAPADVYYGRREEILRRREEQKALTIQARLSYNLGRSEPQPEGGSKLKTIAAASGSRASEVLKTNRRTYL
jgi:transposase InsO family protein